MRRVGIIATLIVWAGCTSSGPARREVSAATANTPDENKDVAAYLVQTDYSKWNAPAQMHCLDKLWHAESRWDQNAVNKGSGACGIPQSLPCDRMAPLGEQYGVDYRTNPWPQIAWGLQYIDERYGSPCKAWTHSKEVGGY